MTETFTMFIGERTPTIEIDQVGNGVSLSVEDGWVNLTASEAVVLSHNLLQVALRADRDATWKAAVGL